MHELPKCKELVRNVFQNKKILIQYGVKLKINTKFARAIAQKKLRTWRHSCELLWKWNNDVENCFRLGFLFLEKENI